MCAGVQRAFSRLTARMSGVGRHIERISRTFSGTAIKRSGLNSCSSSPGGKIRPSSSGVTGCPVAGEIGGAIWNGRSARTLYQCVGISWTGSVMRAVR
jgi:hypothetical protein